MNWKSLIPTVISFIIAMVVYDLVVSGLVARLVGNQKFDDTVSFDSFDKNQYKQAA